MTICHTFPDGSTLDHVAWAVPDTRAGARRVAELTGVELRLRDEPEPGQWYWSAALPLRHGRFLEVIGPAPGAAGHPFADYLARLPEGRLLFWYVRVVDWEELRAAVDELGLPLAREESVDTSVGRVSYHRAGIGDDLEPAVPNAITWRGRPATEEPGACDVVSFHVGHPDRDRLQRVHDRLGTGMTVHQADAPTLRVALRTPRGEVTLTGEGHPLG